MISNLTEEIHQFFNCAASFPASVRIVKVNLDLLGRHVEEQGVEAMGQFYLSQEERERFLHFRFDKRKIEWLGGRIAVKCAALQFENNSQSTSWQQDEWHKMQIRATAHGKPFLHCQDSDDQKLPMISISHSKNIALGLAAGHPCGIDIQQITPAVERVQKRFATDEEKSTLTAICDQHGEQAALALLWSAKEAVKKGASTSKTPGFMDIAINSLQPNGKGFLAEMAVKNNNGKQAASHQVWLTLIENYSFALAMASEEKR